MYSKSSHLNGNVDLNVTAACVSSVLHHTTRQESLESFPWMSSAYKAEFKNGTQATYGKDNSWCLHGFDICCLSFHLMFQVPMRKSTLCICVCLCIQFFTHFFFLFYYDLFFFFGWLLILLNRLVGWLPTLKQVIHSAPLKKYTVTISNAHLVRNWVSSQTTNKWINLCYLWEV